MRLFLFHAHGPKFELPFFQFLLQSAEGHVNLAIQQPAAVSNPLLINQLERNWLAPFETKTRWSGGDGGCFGGGVPDIDFNTVLNHVDSPKPTLSRRTLDR